MGNSTLSYYVHYYVLFQFREIISINVFKKRQKYIELAYKKSIYFGLFWYRTSYHFLVKFIGFPYDHFKMFDQS